MCRKFEVNTLSNNGVITFCDFLSHNSTGYSIHSVFIKRKNNTIASAKSVKDNQ